MKQVQIKGIVVTHEFGTLKDGDILRVSDEFAKHLVEDCEAAEYVSVTEKSSDEKVVLKKGKGK